QFIESTKPWRLRSSGKSPMPAASEPFTLPSGNSWFRTKTFPVAIGSRPKILRHFAAARADQTGETEDFALAQHERKILELAGRRKIFHAQQFLAQFARQMLRRLEDDIAPDHLIDDALVAGLRNRLG